MYLPMKISSERQKGIEIVKEGFLDCGATGKFIDQHYTKDKGLKTTWENLQGTIPCHRTRTTEDHSRIPLVDQDESNNRLAEGNP